MYNYFVVRKRSYKIHTVLLCSTPAPYFILTFRKDIDIVMHHFFRYTLYLSMLIENFWQMMKIRDFAAGSHHAAMVDELGRVFTWGAGSYGRCLIYLLKDGAVNEGVCRRRKLVS